MPGARVWLRTLSGTVVMIFKIFTLTNSEKIAAFDSKQSQILKTFDHNIGI
jgi:hypothetical protein